MSINAVPNNEQLAELKGKLTGKVFSFGDLSAASVAREQYLVCDAGSVLRILRGPSDGLSEGRRNHMLVFQFFDFSGQLITSKIKQWESMGAFAGLFGSKITSSSFLEILDRPSFIPPQDTVFTDFVPMPLPRLGLPEVRRHSLVPA